MKIFSKVTYITFKLKIMNKIIIKTKIKYKYKKLYIITIINN